MRRVLLLVCLLGLALAPAASAAEGATAKVEIGKVGFAAPVSGRGALLVPVHYPVQLLGQRVELRVFLRVPGQREARAWTVRMRASGGALRSPEQRRRFTFVHRIDLSPRLTRTVKSSHGRLRARVQASGALDINRDGIVELDSSDETLEAVGRAARRLCATVPQLRAKPGKTVRVELPACGAPVRWRLARSAQHGTATIRNDTLNYRSARRFRGTDSIELKGRPHGATGSNATGPLEAQIEVKVEQAKGTVVRAIGDSVTAGFGYYDDGRTMPFTSLYECENGKTYDDACSSNSAVRNSKAPAIEYAPDYGLSNNVSWAAQWANEHGVSNYENLAVGGSEPSDWAPGGRLYPTTKQIEAEGPDYILMTLGANPLFSMLFGTENTGCAIFSDIFGGYRECIESAFHKANLRGNLESLYTELVDNTRATIYLMQYPLTVPSTASFSPTQIAMMDNLLNGEIASVGAAVSSTRLRTVAPPHFDVGVDLSPVDSSTYSCSSLGNRVDGPSVQSEPTQDELLASQPLSFCAGLTGEPPWAIAGDTGLHPSAAGYAQMAAQVAP